MVVVGTDWLPFAEMPDLRNIALSGNDQDDSRYLELKQFDAIPPNAVTGNNQVVQIKGSKYPGPSGASGGSSGARGGASGFRPTYD